MRKLACPYCGFVFENFAVNADGFHELAPIVCSACAEVGLLENGAARKLAPGELEAIKQSPAWQDFLAPALEVIKKAREKLS